MKKTKNTETENFINDVLTADAEQGKILVTIRKIVLKIRKDAEEEIKYGGLVFNVDTKLVCGIFIRKKHISLEFTFGMTMSDPDKFLEGNGKYRRHLKISEKSEIKGKKVEFYLRQAFALKY